MDTQRQNLAWGLVLALLAAMAISSCSGGNKQSELSPAASIESAEEIADTYVAPGDEGIIDGSVTYQEHIVLPRGATVVVELFELSADGSAALVARHSFAAESQVPIRFQLGYERSRIDPARTYGVRARVLVDGALWFVNKQPEAVLTRGNPSSVQIVVQAAPSAS